MSDEQISAHDERWLDALKVYVQPRVLIVILLGFSAGLPLGLTLQPLQMWMRESGVDLATIGLFSLVGTPYTFKFIWAPMIDAWRVPVLGRLLGRRRGWLFTTQIVLMAAILVLGAQDPLINPFLVAGAALIVAAASATQDIVIDAFRVESLDDNEQAAGMAGYVAAYRIALLAASVGVIGLVGWLEHIEVASGTVWFWGYAFAAALMLVGMFAVLLGREPEVLDEETEVPDGDSFTRLISTAVTAFGDFIVKPQAIGILVFVLLFKFCDSLAGVMTVPFVVDLGFSKVDYIALVKGVGTIAVLAGGFLGGYIARAVPMITGLWIAGIIQMLSNLVFTWLAAVGADHQVLAIAIVVENLAGGIGTVIFVAYLSALCSSPLHTATQFALLTALTSVGRTFLSAYAGFIAEAAGWFNFFVVTAVAALPGLAMLWWLQSRGHFTVIGVKPKAVSKRPA